MKLILLGAPGAGKGTQAELICRELGIPSISTGNCLREAVAAGTEMGKAAQAYMDCGDLVPDAVVIGIIQDRLKADDCKSGFILDGFPRTVPQAEALDTMGVSIDRVVEIYVSDAQIEERLSGRRVCAKCGAPYHEKYHPPQKTGVCDKCAGELIVRKDDRPETVRDRLRIYHEQTEQLKDYYAQKGKLRVVQGQEEISQTAMLTMQALEA